MKEYKGQIKDKYVIIMDDSYPQCIKLMKCSPMILFYERNLKLIDKDLLEELLV